MSQIWKKPKKGQKRPSRISLNFNSKSKLTLQNTAINCHYLKSTSTLFSNFTTLCLKGLNRTEASIEIVRQWHKGVGNWFAHRIHTLAWHYQAFEALPEERCGGEKNAHSWLNDEAVQSQTRDWLTSQETGKVTPQHLQQALNDVIFPDLNIVLKNPLSE